MPREHDCQGRNLYRRNDRRLDPRCHFLRAELARSLPLDLRRRELARQPLVGGVLVQKFGVQRSMSCLLGLFCFAPALSLLSARTPAPSSSLAEPAAEPEGPVSGSDDRVARKQSRRSARRAAVLE